MISVKCPHCGQVSNKGARVSTYVMFDNHTFKQLHANTVDGLIEEWRALNQSGSECLKRNGRADLCSVIIITASDKELRRVGSMVFRNSGPELAQWRAALLSDADVVALLAQRKAK